MINTNIIQCLIIVLKNNKVKLINFFNSKTNLHKKKFKINKN